MSSICWFSLTTSSCAAQESLPKPEAEKKSNPKNGKGKDGKGNSNGNKKSPI